jgi:hypothetical protein
MVNPLYFLELNLSSFPYTICQAFLQTESEIIVNINNMEALNIDNLRNRRGAKSCPHQPPFQMQGKRPAFPYILYEEIMIMNNTVLIVEDHSAIRSALKQWLKLEFPRINIIDTATGEDAVNIVKAIMPDVVLMDKVCQV